MQVKKTRLDKILKEAQSYIINEEVNENGEFVYSIKVFGKKEIEDKEMKQKEIQDLTKLINDGFNKINSDINGIKIELKEHIQEFKEFKSDMLSLPTISKELEQLKNNNF